MRSITVPSSSLVLVPCALLAACWTGGCMQPFGDLGEFTAGITTTGSDGGATSLPSTGATAAPTTQDDAVTGTTAVTSTGGVTTTGESTTGAGSFIGLPDGGPGPLECTCPEDQICVLSRGIDSFYLECAFPPAGCDPADLCTAACATACRSPPPLPDNCGEREPPTWVECGDDYGYACSTWANNCAEGEKCLPHDIPYYGFLCVPLAEPAAGPGEPCLGQLDGLSSEDSCVEGALCRGVDPVTEEHVCVPHCTGTPAEPGCPADTVCAITMENTVAVCLPPCDPLVQDCEAGSVCALNGDGFVCMFDDTGTLGGAGDDCSEQNNCDPGLACIRSNMIPDSICLGCCLPFCDLGAPDCGPDAACVSLFGDGAAPPEWAHVGACAIPP